jgi:hypothetical protein
VRDADALLEKYVNDVPWREEFLAQRRARHRGDQRRQDRAERADGPGPRRPGRIGWGVLNTRHAPAKQHGWATAPPSAAATAPPSAAATAPPSAAVFARAVAADANLLRRPILVVGDRVIVGFDRAAYASL